MSAARVEESLARLSCTTCRSQKRRCSKELPACELCRRNRRRCEYPASNPSNGPPNAPESYGLVTDAGTGFPALLFLDYYTFKRQCNKLNPPTVALAWEYLDTLGGVDQAARDVDSYFSSFHAAFPIVSKARIYNSLANSIGQPSPDTALLLLSMRLVTQYDTDASLPQLLYSQVKRCYSFVLHHNIFSVKVLQATLLIGFYELANAIFPAAYLTICNCAGIGQVLGVQCRNPPYQILDSAVSWSEAEERRRTWWGVLMLERYTCIGTGSSSFVAPDAKPDDLLPVDEQSWDNGEPTLIQSLAVSASTSIAASPFTRACQATHILSRVLRHINEKHDDTQAYYGEAKQLHSVISLFNMAVTQEIQNAEDSFDTGLKLRLIPAMGLCFSAQIALYDHYTCAEVDASGGIGTHEQLSMQETALTHIKVTCFAVQGFAERINALLDTGVSVGSVSPLTCNCLYAAAVNFIWYIRETGQRELEAQVGVIFEVLGRLSERWNIAKEYLNVLESRRF